MTQSLRTQFGVFPGKLNVYLLPEAFYNAFSQRFDLTAIHDYAKLRQVGSLNDLAHVLVLPQALGLGRKEGSDLSWCISQVIPHSFYGDCPLSMETESSRLTADQAFPLSAEAEAELKNTILPLVRSEAFLTSVQGEYRSLPKEGEAYSLDCNTTYSSTYSGLLGEVVQPQGKLPYRLISHMTGVYIIVGEDFLSFLDDKAHFKQFITEVLKALYLVAPPEIVNTTQFYDLYVKYLKPQ